MQRDVIDRIQKLERDFLRVRGGKGHGPHAHSNKYVNSPYIGENRAVTT